MRLAGPPTKPGVEGGGEVVGVRMDGLVFVLPGDVASEVAVFVDDADVLLDVVLETEGQVFGAGDIVLENGVTDERSLK